MTAKTANELSVSAFFLCSTQLARAKSTSARGEALDELLTLWLHVTNLKVRARCEALLRANDMGAQMDRLRVSWSL